MIKPFLFLQIYSNWNSLYPLLHWLHSLVENMILCQNTSVLQKQMILFGLGSLRLSQQLWSCRDGQFT